MILRKHLRRLPNLRSVSSVNRYVEIPLIGLVMDGKHSRYQKTACPHEAGYDSLLTAQNFLKQAVQLPGARSRASPTPSQHTESVSVQTRGIEKATSKTTLTKNNGNETMNTRTKFAGNNVYEALESIDPEATIETLTVADSGPELIPSFSAPVWKVYGNKLRVFGTQERVFKLDSAGK